MEISRNYIYGIIAIVVLTGVLITWYFFIRTTPFHLVTGTYCGSEPGSGYCYELKDNGTYILRVTKEGSDRDITFESQYRVQGNEISIDSPNDQLGRRTIFTLEGNRLCANGDCRFVKVE